MTIDQQASPPRPGATSLFFLLQQFAREIHRCWRGPHKRPFAHWLCPLGRGRKPQKVGFSTGDLLCPNRRKVHINNGL